MSNKCFQMQDQTNRQIDNVMMPASINKQYKQLFFKIIRGEKLPIVDGLLGTIDAYIRSDYKGQYLKTDVIKMKDNLVQWN